MNCRAAAVEAIALTRERGGRVVAVGTTVARALESAAGPEGALEPAAGETTLFIRPGFQFRVIDALLTNFHLPQSTLLMLVAAFAGREAVLAAYAHAVAERYRFFSYGDAMLVFPMAAGRCMSVGAAALRFELLARDGAARVGRLHLPRGIVDTPVFMPVGTYGTVKAMTPEELEALGAQIVLGNTFHLMLRPGTEIVALHRDGLHGFMGWERPILTDSGGFQVFSLASLRKIDEDGVRFRSPVDGASVHMRPEDAMDVQRALGSDIAMAFDDCTGLPGHRAPGARVDAALDALGPAQPRSLLSRVAVGRTPAGSTVRHRAGRHVRIAAPESIEAARAARFPGLCRSAGWPLASPRRSGCGCSISSPRVCRSPGPVI